MAGAEAHRKIDLLLKLGIEDEVGLASLPPPERSVVVRLGSDRLLQSCEHFRRLWMQLCARSPWEQSKTTRPDPTYLGGTGGLWTALLQIGTYYSFCLFRYAEKEGPVAAKLILDRLPVPGGPTDPHGKNELEMMGEVMRLSARVTLQIFDTCALGLLLAEVLDRSELQSAGLGERFDPDLTAIKAIGSLMKRSEQSSGELALLIQRLLAMAVTQRTNAIRVRGDRRREEARSSQSLIGSSEIVLLGRRSPVMVEKYGEKRIERVFEQQVGLMFNTLGFTVVPARPGEAAADLLCISREERFSFLVDAKTSRKPYSLPKDDQRALSDYVHEFAKDLPDLPPLAFLLIVGPGEASSLVGRLETLSKSIDLPVKFMTAKVLADLHGSLTGPVPARAFRESMVASAPIVDGESVLVASKKALDGVASAYANFVSGLRAAAR